MCGCFSPTSTNFSVLRTQTGCHVKKSVNYICHGLFLVSLFMPLNLYACLYAMTTLFWLFSFVVILKSKSLSSNFSALLAYQLAFLYFLSTLSMSIILLALFFNFFFPVVALEFAIHAYN